MPRRFLVLAVAASLVAGVFSTAAAAQTPATLMGEQLAATILTSSASCTADQSGSGSFSTSGVAAGPYNGTFTETGTFTIAPQGSGAPELTFSAHFRIVSGANVIEGTKTLVGDLVGETAFCNEPFDGYFVIVGPVLGEVTYEAVIRTPEGSFRDEGTFDMNMYECGSAPVCPFESFGERFFSDLDEPTPLLPVAKEQCEGFGSFGVFKNRGDCVSFVATDGKNQPGKKQKD